MRNKTKVYKTKPKTKGWMLSDGARNLAQAKWMVKATPKNMDVRIVSAKKDKREKLFLYHIYTKVKR